MWKLLSIVTSIIVVLLMPMVPGLGFALIWTGSLWFKGE